MAFLASLQIYILPIKYSPPEIRQLTASIIIHGAHVADQPTRADIIVTRLMSRKRLELALGAQIVDSRIVVLERWLFDSIAHRTLLDHRPYLVPQDHPLEFPVPPVMASFFDHKHLEPDDSSPPSSPDEQPAYKRPRTSTPAPVEPELSLSSLPSRPPTPSTYDPFRATPEELIPPDHPHSRIDPASLPKLACSRVSPLICVNQHLIEELDVVRKWKEIGEDDPGARSEEKHELAYLRACSSLKAYPTKIRTVDEAKAIPFVGTKIALQIEEYLSTGLIALAKKLRADARLKTILLFETLHGVGAHLARELYDVHHCKTLEDVIRVKPELQTQVDCWSDLQTKIPRDTVAEIALFIHQQLDLISPGSIYTICGSYRRGRSGSNDVDIVFTHPSLQAASKISLGVLNKLTDRLKEIGALVDVLPGSHIGSKPEEGLNQRFIIFKFPHQPRRFRVDLIFARFEVYWISVIGWTGSTAFERDIRQHARSLSLKFNSHGVSRLADGSPLAVPPDKGEKGVFEALGLEWLDPIERNADV